MHMKRTITLLIKFTIKKLLFIVGVFSKKDTVMFVPHAGMCKKDYYDIINYKSDSSLTFLHYILDNGLLTEKKILVATRDDVDYDIYYEYIHNHYPNRDIIFSPIFANKSYSILQQIFRYYAYCKNICKCTHVFTSITHDFSGIISNQVLVDLNYYTCSMKNDILDKNSPYYMGLEKVGREYNYIIGTSELAIRLIMPEMTIPYNKYVNLGMCRNDNLLKGDKCEWLRKEYESKVSYPVKSIILYTPTHRDYESNNSNSIKRSVLGFKYDNSLVESVLRKEGIIIVCKLHPKQNALIIEEELPEGLLLHKADSRYGLTEMMLVSDALITDYTSAYFDYLLLDKPIIFNYYDLDIYKKERGVPFEPMSAISAGDIVENESQMISALIRIDENREQYRQKRKLVRDLFFTFQDSNSCRRVFDFIFN